MGYFTRPGIKDDMKAISVKQPWAAAIETAQKTIETRTWATKYRGPLLIVSSLKPDKAILESLKEDGMDFSVPGMLIYGSAIAMVNLMDCRPMTKEDEDEAMCEIYPNAFSWVLKDIVQIKPFPVKGKLGIYEVPCSALGALL